MQDNKGCVSLISIHQLYLQGKEQLTKAGCESPAFDAAQLVHFVFGLDRQGLLLYGDRLCEEAQQTAFCSLIHQRASGYPLQYLLKAWCFYGRSFAVGPGVLIPREETELLVREAVRFCGDRPCAILDLCAGSGAIALTCACEMKNAQVTAVEFSDDALRYLQENNRNLCNGRVHVIHGDICTAQCVQQCGEMDVILSNPPYIPQADLLTLQREVQYEPRMALDGGVDGLLFYREILLRWLPKLRPNGMLAVECGIGQSDALAALFCQSGLKNICVINDFNGIGRVVRGEKPKQPF